MIRIMIFIIFVNSLILFNSAEITEDIKDFITSLKINFVCWIAVTK